MKKVLALFLAVLMIASLGVTMISAETQINVEEVCADYANAKRYIGPATETAPVLDGVISEGEYTWSLTGQKIIDHINGTPEHIDDSYTNLIGEYAAYDADWVYYATTVVQYGNVTTPRMEIRMSHDYLIGTELKTFSVGRDIEDDLGMTFEGGIFNVVPEGVTAPSEEQYAYKTVENNGSVTFEFKISRAYLAEQMGLESAADYTKFTYFTYLGWTYFNCANGAWSYIYTDYYMTEADRAALAEAGVTTPLIDAGSGGAAKLFSMLVLGEKPAEEEEPEDLGKWGNLAEELGMNVHVDAAAKSPVLDGVISEGEYTAILHNDKEDIKNYGTNIKDDNGLTEYFAHDADYIYYAVSYANPNGGVAFQWQFKPFNSFDIYNPSGADDYYHNRLSGQARYNEAYANKYRYWNTDYTGSWAHVFTHTTSVRAPYMHKTMVAGSYEEYHCAGGINNGISVFEAKIAKAYIAEINNCEIADVKVVPYFTFLHSADNIGVLMNAQQVDALKEAGAEFTPAAGDIAYRFIVLDGTSEAGVQDYIAAATNSTASVRISEQNPGLRFKTTVNTGDLNMLIDKVGVENVKVGTLIAPTDKVGAKALTHAFGEAGVDYLDVVADVTDPFGTDGYKTVFAGSIANIKTANLNRDFTAVGYVAYFDGEAWNYSYSAAAAEKNVSDVAYAAYTDIAFEEAEGYTNEIVGEGDTLKGAYSPYTEVQRAVLKALIVEINIEDNFGGDIFAD